MHITIAAIIVICVGGFMALVLLAVLIYSFYLLHKYKIESKARSKKEKFYELYLNMILKSIDYILEKHSLKTVTELEKYIQALEEQVAEKEK